jgi:hypothetical protein
LRLIRVLVREKGGAMTFIIDGLNTETNFTHPFPGKTILFVTLMLHFGKECACTICI